jgi:hypothetical protein
MGVKGIENRGWSTKFRGRFAVHVAMKSSREEWEAAEKIVDDPDQWDAIRSVLKAFDVAGRVIGTVELADVVWGHPSKWVEPGKWHWILRDPEPMAPVPAKGRLGLWEWKG